MREREIVKGRKIIKRKNQKMEKEKGDIKKWRQKEREIGRKRNERVGKKNERE